MAVTRKLGLPNITQILAAQIGSPEYLGIIEATTAKNNSDTTTPFVIPEGAMLLCATSADVQWLGQSTATAATTTTDGVLQDISEDGTKWIVFLKPGQAYLSCVGAANVKVWTLG